MKLNHINKIKANISIFSNKKTSNILDGTYKSVYKGKSMNFENLREYVINDDIKDIDWKSSARSGTLLVKQFIAEKKHNILIIFDSGTKMDAVTDKLENKKELSINIAGTIGYIAVKNGDYIGFCYNNDSNVVYKPFKDTLYNLEEYLCCYESNICNRETNLNETLKYIYKNITKRMIIFVITDIAGIDNLQASTIKQINSLHDLLVININDCYMYGNELFDVTNNEYIPNMISKDLELNKIEHEIRKGIYDNNSKKLNQNKVSMISISSVREINNKIIELLEEHRYANTN